MRTLVVYYSLEGNTQYYIDQGKGRLGGAAFLYFPSVELRKN